MELRHLRYFTAVAEESTFVAAASRLNLAQPALTRQIHDLEREIGVDLFDRGPRGATLTPAGEVCLVSARHILKQVEHAMERARGSSEGAAGRCVICVGARGLVSGLIARIVARIHAEYPQIELIVTEGVGPAQWKALQLKEVDIGLGLPVPSGYPTIVSETFDHDIFDSILISRDHPLASRSRVVLQDLADEMMLTLSPTLAPEFDRLLRSELKRLDFKPRQRRAFEETVSLLAMVAAGHGFAFIGRAMEGMTTDATTIIPVAEFAMPMAHAILYRSADSRPVVRTVVDTIRRITSEDREAAGRAPISLAPPKAPAPSTPDGGSPGAAALAIELRHLRYYCAVVDARSFGRAAERLELTQPALSRQIRDLERAVGIQLLERAARGATTTPGGESFYRSARHILDEADALPAEAHRAERGVQARCVIASVPTSDARLLHTELVRRVFTELPSMQVMFEEMPTTKQPFALRAATIDLGLCHASPISPVEARGLRRERLLDDQLSCALLPADSTLGSRDSIELRDLTDIPFLFMNRAFQPGLYDQVYAEFARLGFHPRVENTYEGLKTVWTLVAEGRGWGVAFESQCSNPPPGTAAVRVDGLTIPWGLDVIARANEARSSILTIIDMMHEIARERPNRAATP